MKVKCCFCYREKCVCEEISNSRLEYGDLPKGCICVRGEDCECERDVIDDPLCDCNRCSGCDNFRHSCRCESQYDFIDSRYENFEFCIRRIIYDFVKLGLKLKKQFKIFGGLKRR